MPTVLSIYYRHKPGGFTKRLYRAYQAIAASGHQLVYIAAEPLPVQGENIRPVILRMRSRNGSLFFWPEFYARAILKMRELNRQHQVQTHFIFSFFYASIAIFSTIGRPARILAFIRGDDVFDAQFKRFAWLRTQAHRWLEWLGVRYTTRVIATNDAMRQAIAARAGAVANIDSLPNDITTSPLPVSLPKAGETVRLVTVSVLNERKNVKRVLEALAQLTHLDWEYYIVGPDNSGVNHGEYLQQFAEQAGIAGRVHFLGWREDTATILQHCHLFVFPTLTEGSPNALLEAMGYGLPCLASNIPEIVEILRDPELTFDPHDMTALGNKLERFMQSPAYAEKLLAKTAVHQQRYRFDWDQRIVALINSDSL